MSFKTLIAFTICGIIAMALGIHALHGLETSFAANAAAVDAAVATKAMHPATPATAQKPEPQWVPVDQWPRPQGGRAK